MKNYTRNLLLSCLLATPLLASAGVVDAGSESFGLYAPAQYEVVNGNCQSCALSSQARFYFGQDIVALPTKSATSDNVGDADRAPLIWLGSSKVLNNARFGEDGKEIDLGAEGKMPLSIVPKISTNLSYYNEATQAFFAGRQVRLRGEVTTSADGKQSFVARTIWPQDFTIKPGPVQPLAAGESLRSLVTAENGGAKSAYSTRVLWQKEGVSNWQGKAVLGLMLNGAQGDDDESLGGHFGVMTGRYEDGSMHHWLVNNFYGLNSFGEKGILAGVTPMDKYLADLNNGQSYYRPSYMLVAILSDARIPQAYQAHIGHSFKRFYEHDFEYDHANNNCSGISSDGLRDLGWQFPVQGNSDKIKAIPAYAYVAATKGSLHEGRKIYDYLTAESTRLYPAVAFDAIGEDMLALAQNKAKRKLSDFEKDLGAQVEAIVFVRIPQFPSSRAFGAAPVASFSEYMKTAPANHDDWKIVPAAPRPFPDQLRVHPAKVVEEAAMPMPVLSAVLTVLALLFMLGRFLVRRFSKRKTK